MNREGSRELVSRHPVEGRGVGSLTACLGILCGLVLSGSVRAAEPPDPNDWDLELRTDKAQYVAGETVVSTSGVVAKEVGLQGWSYGVQHDPGVLQLQDVTIEGTDVKSVFDNGFNQTIAAEGADGKKGYIQAVVLSFVNPAQVPISDYFSIAKATYEVTSGACDGKDGAFSTAIQYVSEVLGVAQSPPVELLLTVGGRSVVPTRIANAAPTIACGGEPPVGGIALTFDKADTDLRADKTEVYQIKVRIENGGEGAVEAEGWSYGVTLDFAELEVLSGEAGVDSKALRGGQGPEFLVYNLDESGGGKRGVTVGAVIDLTPPATNTLAVPAAGRKHVDTIKVRSQQIIAAGAPSRTTVIGLSDSLGAGDRVVEAIVTVGGDSIVPDIADTLTLTLFGSEAPERPRFIRADSNNDAKVDIADGVWIINNLFYSGPETRCKPAADANDDGKIDLADALYIFNYQLQPGRTTSNLYPAPSAPFPNCGSVDGVTFADCPDGSTVCMQ